MENNTEFLLFSRNDNTTLYGSKVKMLFIEWLFSLVTHKPKVWGLLWKSCSSIKFTFIPTLALKTLGLISYLLQCKCKPYFTNNTRLFSTARTVKSAQKVNKIQPLACSQGLWPPLWIRNVEKMSVTSL